MFFYHLIISYKFVGKTLRLGISGSPGAGKSSLIDVLGTHYVTKGHKVAVIPVDPSSHLSGGSLLGDKVRMENLTKFDEAYIRATPTRCVLGGIAEHTSDIIELCEYAGYDIIIIESVGVGQSEVELDYAVDLFVLLVNPGGGDDIQASKKGVMEAVDIVLIGKADGDLLRTANHTKADYGGSLSFIRKKNKVWRPVALLISSRTKEGLETFVTTISDYHKKMVESGLLLQKRNKQKLHWMWSHFQRMITTSISNDEELAKVSEQLNSDLSQGFISPRKAAFQLFSAFSRNAAHLSNRE